MTKLSNLLLLLFILPAVVFGQEKSKPLSSDHSDSSRIFYLGVDFGLARSGSTTQKDVSFDNPIGSDFRIIDVSRSCGCTQATLKSDQVPANGKLEMSLELQHGKDVGSQHKRVMMLCQSKEGLFEIEFRLKAEVRSNLQVSPGIQWFLTQNPLDGDSALRFRVYNYFERGEAPSIEFPDGTSADFESNAVVLPINENGLVSAWDCCIKVPKKWQVRSNRPQSIDLRIRQQVGSKEAVEDLLVPVVSSEPFILRPSTLDLSSDEPLTCDVFVRVAGWKADSLGFQSSSGSSIPFAIEKQTSKFVRVRFDPLVIRKLISIDDKSINVTSSDREISIPWSVKR